MSKGNKGRRTKPRKGSKSIKKENSNNMIHTAKGETSSKGKHVVKKDKSWKASHIVSDNWACCVYMILSMLVTHFVFTPIKNSITQYMSIQKIGDGFISSNWYTQENVFVPFAGSVSLVLCVILACIFLVVYIKIVKKLGFELNNITQWLLFVEVITIILSAIVVIYCSCNYQIMSLGINAENVRSGNSLYAPLMEIPKGYGIMSVEDEPLILTIFKAIASFNVQFVKNIDLYVSIVGAIFIPLKIYDSIKNAKQP